jgi:N-acetylglucosaminyl-diphospho-decaprenol L-rhamnosyltransferase
MISKQGLRTFAGRTILPRTYPPQSEDYNPCFVDMPRCTAIIVTYNSADHIEACLMALASQSCDIVVVDNASHDDTVARVQALAARIPLQLIKVSRNIGFAGGVNHGARAASGEVLLILNPDAVAEPMAVESLMECLTRSGAAAAGGALLDSDGQPARGFAFRRLPTLSNLMFEALLINQLWSGNPVNRRYRCLDADHSQEQEIDQPAGACMAVTRTAWEEAQGMDTQFFPVWFEDVDFCARLRASGAKIMYCPAARFRHVGAHSVGQLEFGDKQMFWYANMLRYARKHFAPWRVLVLRAGIVVGMGLRILAATVGAGPRRVPWTTAVRGYWRVTMMALGFQ